MSTTVTSPQLAQVLDDYKIHLTGAEVSPSAQSTSTLPNAENPSNWPTQHYRVPNYRPINRDLDMSERPLGSNGGEFAFLVIMFSGVTLNATIARAWGATGGPYFPGLFKYAIGGEW